MDKIKCRNLLENALRQREADEKENETKLDMN